MSASNKDLIKEVRSITSAGICACKNALEEANWDKEEAIKLLRKYNLAKAGTRIGKTSENGLITVCDKGDYVTLLELNCETDFVSANEKFKKISNKLASCIQPSDDVETLLSRSPASGAESLGDELLNCAGVFNENLKLSRLLCFTRETGTVVFSYIHQKDSIYKNMGLSATLVKLQTNISEDKLTDVKRALGTQILGSSSPPKYINFSDIPNSLLEEEKEIFMSQHKDSKKPQEIIEKIVTGQIKKSLEDSVLMSQKLFVPEALGLTVEQYLKQESKALDGQIVIKEFKVFEVGKK